MRGLHNLYRFTYSIRFFKVCLSEITWLQGTNASSLLAFGRNPTTANQLTGLNSCIILRENVQQGAYTSRAYKKELTRERYTAAEQSIKPGSQWGFAVRPGIKKDRINDRVR